MKPFNTTQTALTIGIVACFVIAYMMLVQLYVNYCRLMALGY